MIPPNRIVREVQGAQGTRCALIAPSAELASCVRAYVTRSTLGANLTPEERCNHFPPTPTCVLTWVLAGQLYRGGLKDTLGAGAAGVPVVFSGPQTQASSSHATGAVQLLSLFLYPDALHALTGLDIAAQVDRFNPLGAVLDAAWQRMADAVLHAPDDAARIALIEAFLAPRWQAVQSHATHSPRQFQDWSRGVSQRASTQQGGQSDRQIDRRIKAWTGQPLRQLRGIGRAEDSLLRARAALDADALRWADVAADCGYADQAHLSREFRKITGLRPGELQAHLAHESYWMYQVWAQAAPLLA
jgi:AraC-like DNA-binding protein